MFEHFTRFNSIVYLLTESTLINILVFYLQSNLQWSTQKDESCLKANRKHFALRNVKMLKKNVVLLYKVTVRSVIDYAWPIYANTLNQTELARLERLQSKAAKLVSGALYLTSQEKLNLELGWESIKKRIEFLGLSLFQKIHFDLLSEIV